MIYGLDADTGKQKWSFHSGGALFSSSKTSFSNDEIPFFIPGMDSNIYAFSSNAADLKVSSHYIQSHYTRDVSIPNLLSAL